MNRETAREIVGNWDMVQKMVAECIVSVQFLSRLNLIKAFADGKTIQAFSFGKWHDCDDPPFLHAGYRVKPEPKLRPYNRDELLGLMDSEAEFIHQREGYRRSIFKVECHRCGLVELWIGGLNIGPDTFLVDFKHADGRPCGVLEQ